MSAISKLKQARNVEELAAEIEPLAQALATLSDDAKQAIAELLESSQKQTENWIGAQKNTAVQWTKAAEEFQSAALDLVNAADTAKRASRGWTWRLWIGVFLASIMPILVLLIASFIWLHPQLVTQQGITYLFFQLNG